MNLFSISRLLSMVVVVCVAMLGVRGVDFWREWDKHGRAEVAQSVEPVGAALSRVGIGYDAQATLPEPASQSNDKRDPHEGDSDKSSSHEDGTGALIPVVPLGAGVSSDKEEGTSGVSGGTDAIPRAFSPAEVQVLQDLSRRRIELDKREAALDRRDALITAAAQQVDSKVVELQNLREDIKQLLGQVDEQQKQRIASLVKIYETMKPRDSAAIIETLEQSVALSVLEQMREAKSAPILAAMSPAKASELTVAMSQRQKLPDLPAE